jgi:hypothetical protein
MFVVSVVCCQVEVSATSWSPVQRSPTICGSRCVWSRNLKNEEAMTRVGSQRHSKKKIIFIYALFIMHTNFFRDTTRAYDKAQVYKES